MPKIGDQYINVRGEDETRYHFKAKATVNTDGDFSVEIDPRVAVAAMKLEKTKEWRDKVAIHKKSIAGAQMYACAKVLAWAVAFLTECGKDWLAVETVKERVIAYRLNASVACWITKDGKIKPNGTGAKNGDWYKRNSHKLAHASYDELSKAYGIAVRVEVFDRTTYKRPSGDTYTWERVDEHEASPAGVLNKWTGIGFTTEGNDKESFDVIPYTDEAAEFFHRILTGLCRLAVELDGIFKAPDVLQNMIATKGQLLLKP